MNLLATAETAPLEAPGAGAPARFGHATALPRHSMRLSRRGRRNLCSRSPDALGHRVGADAEVDAARAAEAVVAVWHDADRALRPVIGARSVVALFNRSAHLAAAAHPWLARAGQDEAEALDLPALRAVFAPHGASQVRVAGHQLLQQLHGLLEHLIGAALTERLLRTAWALLGGRPACWHSGEAPA